MPRLTCEADGVVPVRKKKSRREMNSGSNWCSKESKKKNSKIISDLTLTPGGGAKVPPIIYMGLLLPYLSGPTWFLFWKDFFVGLDPSRTSPQSLLPSSSQRIRSFHSHFQPPTKRKRAEPFSHASSLICLHFAPCWIFSFQWCYFFVRKFTKCFPPESCLYK